MKEHLHKKLKAEFTKIPIPESDQILELMSPAYATGENRKFMKMYNWMSLGYDFVEQKLGRLKYRDKVEKMRTEMISELEWKNGAKVLVVSIGTGRDLDFIPEPVSLDSLDLIGVDISLGMMKRCQKKFSHLKKFSLVHCCAEELPFKANQFDIVFHVGGINFFNDKEKAIREMIRVAKKGTKLMIADETEMLVDELYSKTGFSQFYIGNRQINLGEVEGCIPRNIQEKKTRLLWEGRFYCITFRK